ncbi:tail fiber domain-containing protein [Chitinophaga sp. Hz27]|uniref:tail fiber domain-containing protein n=1 Tax=Chitinophaga sp. Hz27 TaxID=3347169 RepID=UPI0035E2E375
MKKVILSVLAFLLTTVAFGQKVYQIRADSVRIYNVCDTAELILENKTQQVKGFLFNRGYGRTEFQKLKLQAIGNSRIAITGQDTLDLSILPGIGGSNISAGSGLIKVGDSLYFGGNLTRDTKIDAKGQSFLITNGNGKDTSYAVFGNPKNALGIPWPIYNQNGNLFASKTGNGLNGYTSIISQTPTSIRLTAFEPATMEDGGSYINVNQNNMDLQGLTNLQLTGGSAGLIFNPYGFEMTGNYGRSVFKFTSDNTNSVAFFHEPAYSGPIKAYYHLFGPSSAVPQDMEVMVFRNLKESLTKTALFRLESNGNNAIGTTHHILSLGLSNPGITNPRYPIGTSANITIQTSQIGNITSYSGLDTLPTNLILQPFAGNIGIGDTLANYTLDVNGTIRATNASQGFLAAAKSASTGDAGLSINRSGSTSQIHAGSWNNTDYSTKAPLELDANQVNITGDLNVVGKTTFNEVLTFNKPISTGNRLIDLQQGYGIYSDNQDGIDGNLQTNRIWFEAPNSGSMVFGPRRGVDYLANIRLKTNQLRLDGVNGKWANMLSIGTNATGDIMNTSGSFIQNQTTAAQNASFTISGTATATGFYQSSKASLKKDIADFNESGLSLLGQVKIKQFIYKSDAENYLHFGIIADSTDWHFAGKNHDRFDTNNSLAITMKAVQELTVIKDKQEIEITTLKSENEVLKQQLAEILKRVQALEKQ